MFETLLAFCVLGIAASISSGGFSKEARYEAERATHPTTLIDLGELASLVVQHYESFDVEGRVLLPLVKVYLPVE